MLAVLKILALGKESFDLKGDLTERDFTGKGRRISPRKNPRVVVLWRQALAIMTTVQQNSEVGQNVTIDHQPPTPVKSRTGQNLENSAFGKIIEHEGIFTRQKARELGFTKAQANIEKAHGFKLQDVALLSECISAAAICSSCKIPSSRLKMFQDNSERDGLAEHLFFSKMSNPPGYARPLYPGA